MSDWGLHELREFTLENFPHRPVRGRLRDVGRDRCSRAASRRRWRGGRPEAAAVDRWEGPWRGRSVDGGGGRVVGAPYREEANVRTTGGTTAAATVTATGRASRSASAIRSTATGTGTTATRITTRHTRITVIPTGSPMVGTRMRVRLHTPPATDTAPSGSGRTQACEFKVRRRTLKSLPTVTTWVSSTTSIAVVSVWN